MYELTSSIHVALFSHGLDSHSFIAAISAKLKNYLRFLHADNFSSVFFN